MTMPRLMRLTFASVTPGRGPSKASVATSASAPRHNARQGGETRRGMSRASGSGVDGLAEGVERVDLRAEVETRLQGSAVPAECDDGPPRPVAPAAFCHPV